MKPLLAVTIVAALLSPVVALAQGKVLYPRAQALADGVVTRNPDMLDVILHVSPGPQAKNIVVAAHLRGANGEDSGEDDLGVMKTGAPLVEVQKDGARLGVLVQMRDAEHHAIGALGLMFPYKPGDDVEATVRRAFAIRDGLAGAIHSPADLVG
jgi:hypothetical protein